MNFRIQILIAPLIAVALMLVFGVITFFGLRSIQHGVDDIANVSMRQMVQASESREALLKVNVDVFKLFTWMSNYDDERIKKETAAIKSRIDDAIAKLDALKSPEASEEKQKIVTGAIEELRKYQKTVLNSIDMATSDITAGAGMMMAANKLYNGIAASLDRLVAIEKQETAERIEASQRNTTRIQMIAVILIAAAIAASLTVAWRITATVTNQLNGMVSMFAGIEKSLDFTQRIPVKGNNEISQTADAFNRLLDRLQASFREISQHTHSVGMAAQQLAGVAQEMTKATSQQSEASSSMAATMEEMTVSIHQISERAIEANALSGTSGEQARNGGAIIGETVTSINGIAHTVQAAAGQLGRLEQQSEQINHVVSVIKDIADQTNLLALNAAIEAARAGEQGRGFAVVADEVRKLAERTTQSTMEIDVTITEMQSSTHAAVQGIHLVVQEVESGVQGAERANQAIQAIGDSSRSTGEMVRDISTAINEQNAASASIARQVEQIAQMSETNSEISRNTSGTANELAQLAAQMQEAVSQYRV